jgi:Tat protein secretion system quality control protein TatD with DNase activity
MAFMFVDSHCHLTFPELHGRIDAIRTDMAAARWSSAQRSRSFHAFTISQSALTTSGPALVSIPTTKTLKSRPSSVWLN